MTKPLPPDLENLNDRAEWAAAALRHFQCTTGTDYEDALGDLLCDLMHWSDRDNFDFEAALARARMHYEAETATARPASPRTGRTGDSIRPGARGVADADFGEMGQGECALVGGVAGDGLRSIKRQFRVAVHVQGGPGELQCRCR